MPYVIIEDFRAGLDRRKMAAASVQGSLQICTNAHITRGGEIEKRRAFVGVYALPAGQTYGLEGAAGVLYTFGSDASPAIPPAIAGLPGITYQQLEHPDGASPAMNDLVATELFDGKIFAVASYANGDALEYYDGAQVADFDAGSGAYVEGQNLTSILTFGDKLYGTALSVLYFSVVAKAEVWKDAGGDVGSGFKNMSTHAAGSETLTALGKYQNSMAVFARRNIQLWNMDPDPANNVQRQILSNIGTYAPKSVVAFGEIDVFFLADTGVRSLRARSNSDRAGITDVGTPVDDELKTYLKTLSEPQRQAAVAAIDPENGRYILAVGERCYVFSHFPDAKISAWSRYDPGFVIDDLVSDDGRLWARSGDTVYLYGGAGGEAYDSVNVEVDLPYIDGRQIATFKEWTGLDVVCEGAWVIYASTDPEQPNEESVICRVEGTTIQNPAIAMVGHSPVIKLRLVNEAAGAAKLSKIVVHYAEAESG
jgi:hypothetical protein